MENIDAQMLKEMRLGMTKNEFLKRFDHLIGYKEQPKEYVKREPTDIVGRMKKFIIKKRVISNRDFTRQFMATPKIDRIKILNDLLNCGFIISERYKNFHGADTVLYKYNYGNWWFNESY